MQRSRRQMLEDFLKKDPKDSFSRYGLAMEYINGQQYRDGIAHLRILLEQDPDYIPAYFQMGQALERTDQIEDARRTYEQGIAACRRKGDQKTQGELEFALQQLSDLSF